MNDSFNNDSQAAGQPEGKAPGSCGGGSCCSPMNCCDWKSISERAKAVITDPKNVWTSIKEEKKSIKEIYISYLIPLAVIGTLCGVLGQLIFGGGAGFFMGLITAVVGLAVSMGVMFVNAHVYKLLAPHFQGSTDETATFKLLAYSSTASLIGAFITIFPPLAIVTLFFAIYSLYTIYQGIPVMTGVSEKRISYFVVCFIATIIINVIIGAVVMGILGVGYAGSRVI